MDQEAFDALKSRVDALEKTTAELAEKLEKSNARFEAFLDEYNPFRARTSKITDTYFNGENDR